MTFWYIALIASTNSEDTSSLHSVFNKVSRFVESIAFLGSIKATYSFPFLFGRYFWDIKYKVSTWSVVEYPLLKQAWVSSILLLPSSQSYNHFFLVLQCSIYPVYSIMRHLYSYLAHQSSLFVDRYNDRLCPEVWMMPVLEYFIAIFCQEASRSVPSWFQHFRQDAI